MTVSLVFWLMLLAAAGLYSAVALSPKLLSYIELRDQHFRNQVQLVELERSVQHLQRVAAALEHEPDFAEELARVEFDAGRPNDRRLEVQETLWLNRPDNLGINVPTTQTLPWYAPLIRAFAGHQRLRSGSLLLAAALVLLAFTFVHESHEAQLRSAVQSVRRSASRVADRYSRSTDH